MTWHRMWRNSGPRRKAADPVVRLPHLLRCARCGQPHENIEFRRLTVPALDGQWTHWAPSAANGEPILFRLP